MIIIDNGKISPCFEMDCQEEDWYLGLRGNLQQLLNENIYDYFLYDNEVFSKTDRLLYKLIANDLRVDLHILPLKFFKNKDYRQEVMKKHKDPNFFKNCFSPILRLRNGKQFVPVDVSYFEYKYRCDLRDMKK